MSGRTPWPPDPPHPSPLPRRGEGKRGLAEGEEGAVPGSLTLALFDRAGFPCREALSASRPGREMGWSGRNDGRRGRALRQAQDGPGALTLALFDRAGFPCREALSASRPERERGWAWVGDQGDRAWPS